MGDCVHKRYLLCQYVVLKTQCYPMYVRHRFLQSQLYTIRELYQVVIEDVGSLRGRSLISEERNVTSVCWDA